MGPEYRHTGLCFCGEGREDSPGCRSSTLFDQLCLAHHSVVTVSWQSPVLTLTFWNQLLCPHYIATDISGDHILGCTLPHQDSSVGPGAAHVAARAHLGTGLLRAWQQRINISKHSVLRGSLNTSLPKACSSGKAERVLSYRIVRCTCQRNELRYNLSASPGTERNMLFILL